MSGAATAELREELARMRASLDRLERGLQQLEDGAAPARRRPRPARYYAVLVEVYEHGVHGVSPGELWALAAAHGYDRRGLGGYFTGSRAPLRSRGERIVLTAEGRRLVDEHLEALHG